MTPDNAIAAYRRALNEAGETIAIRRYTGTGEERPFFDVEVIARVTEFRPGEFVGPIEQGDRRVVMLAEDIADTGLALPLVTTDKVVIRGRELVIIAPDDSTRRIRGRLIAYELIARG